MDKHLLSGNEAVARGAWEGGVRFGAAYPGTPSTEILEELSTYEGVTCQWSTNEKVALEVAAGATFGGVRALTCMKHVGLNVAADPFFSMSYIGAHGGLVVVSADDPGMHSSQNEQDSRRYAVAAGLPMLEPSDSQESYDFTLAALELSARWKLPVILRMTTRDEAAHAIKSMQTRGAPLIGAVAAYGLCLALRADAMRVPPQAAGALLSPGVIRCFRVQRLARRSPFAARVPFRLP